MAKVVVSFSTRPGLGSEGGVGWAFVRAAILRSAAENEHLHVVFDARDEQSVRAAVELMVESVWVTLHPVAIPRVWRGRFGLSRSRASYLAWRGAARRRVRRIAVRSGADTIHQFTFATATLPHAMPKLPRVRRLWGPVAVPWALVDANGWRRLAAPLVVLAGQFAARLNVIGIDQVIATNERSAQLLRSTRGRSGEVVVEPNVVVDLPLGNAVERDDNLLAIVGLLDGRKRPWLALKALTLPGMERFRLAVVGHGPLRDELQHLVARLGLTDRVEFHGLLERRDALTVIARSRVLVHPSMREGAAWVIGEAAAVGVPAVVFDQVGGATTVALSENGGVVCSSDGDLPTALARGIIRAAEGDRPQPSKRWSEERLPVLLTTWWGQSIERTTVSASLGE